MLKSKIVPGVTDQSCLQYEKSIINKVGDSNCDHSFKPKIKSPHGES